MNRFNKHLLFQLTYVYNINVNDENNKVFNMQWKIMSHLKLNKL